jgi:hypothetical protein
LALLNAGSNIESNSAIIAITINSSINVKAPGSNPDKSDCLLSVAAPDAANPLWSSTIILSLLRGKLAKTFVIIIGLAQPQIKQVIRTIGLKHYPP